VKDSTDHDYVYTNAFSTQVKLLLDNQNLSRSSVDPGVRSSTQNLFPG